MRTSIPDVRLSDVEDPERLALVLAFRAEVGREVRPGEFSDLQGLIQKLSTGVQARPDNGSHAGRAAGMVLRLEPRPTLLEDRQELLAELAVRLAGSDGASPQIAVLYGLGGTGKTSVAVEYAYRHLAEVGMAWQFPAEDPAVLRAEFAKLA
ncbi:MAG TPA: hypothetical protein VEH31_40445, partial [Streptosporangiaceae bacterium]|nr:hypothetical protein [Streptosporangiaceae bacterium]